MHKQLTCWLLYLLLASPVLPSTYYVATNGSDTAAGTSWDTAFLTINKGVLSRTAGDKVIVSNGTYVLAASIVLTNGITLESFSGATNTIIDANNINHGVEMRGPTDVLDGFTITNGCVQWTPYPADQGGGVWCKSGGIVQNCLIMNNKAPAAYKGAGVWLVDSTMINCRIISNIAQGSIGGISMAGSSILTNCTIQGNISCKGSGGGIAGGGAIYNCKILNNTAGTNGGTAWLAGGGIYSGTDVVDICACLISSNTVLGSGDKYGGGVASWDHGGAIRTTIRNCTIQYNEANSGGGVNLQTDLMENCLVVSNRASANGGGIQVGYDYALMRNCTIVGNTAGGQGGGIKFYHGGRADNCIVVSNISVGAGTNWYIDAGYSAVMTNSCTTPTNAIVGTGNITNNPSFVNYSGGNYRLAANSPCINKGTNQDWMTNAVDLDGKIRIRYGTVDMGAYERIYEGTSYKFH